jgi:putative ABC transport system permease protein
MWVSNCNNCAKSGVNPFEFSFYNDFLQAKYIKEKQLSLSVTLLSIIALILTLMGILGQVIQASSKRTKEIGIRKVNGASILEIVLMFNKTFLVWMAISLIISIPIAYFLMSRWLSAFAYRTELSWWLFLLSGLVVAAFSLLTVSWISWKAARVNPVESLRYE